MKKNISKILAVTTLAVLPLITFAVTADNTENSSGVVCPQDVRICPDGSSVGRIPPKCRFKLCPNSTNTDSKSLRDLKDERNQINQEIKTKKTEIASSTKERIENRRDERRENLKRIAENKLDKMIKRFEATIQRENSISEKIMSRVEKIKSNGGDTTEAEKYLGEAKTHFDEATKALLILKNATSSADTLIDANTSTSTIIKNGLKKLKDMAQNVEKHIREGHKSLTQAVKSLRGKSRENNATSTSNN